MSTARPRLARSVTGVAAAALLGSGLLFTPTAQAANKVISSNLVDQSQTRATGHNDFGADGVHVYTESNTSTDKAAGYFDVNKSLADAGEPKLSWSGSAARPGSQLVTDFDGDGNIDGILVGEPANSVVVEGETVPDWWVTNGSKQFVKDRSPSQNGDVAVGGSGSVNHGTMDQWRTRFPDAVIFQAGWSLGSGIKGDGTINSITVGDDKYFFVKSEDYQNVELYKSDVDTSSTRSKGHNDFRPTSGVRVYTDPITPNDPADEGHYAGYANKAAGMFPVDQPLSTAGEPTMDFRTLSGSIPPGLWLNLDVDGDGEADGTIIKEPAYGNDWWLNDTEGPLAEFAPIDGGGSGSNLHGALTEWRANLPAGTRVVTTGWSLGGGVEGDFIVDRITIGLKKFTFTGANRAPSAEGIDATSRVGVDAVVPLTATDPDGDELTYSTETPGASIDGDELTVSVPRCCSTAPRSATYTVEDGRGGSDTATVTVNVLKANPNVRFFFTKASSTAGKSARIGVTVSSSAAVTNGYVDAYVDGKKVGTARLPRSGYVGISIGKAKKGTHQVKVRYRGSSLNNPVALTQTLKVK